MTNKWGTPRNRAENCWESWSDLENTEELLQLIEGHIEDAVSDATKERDDHWHKLLQYEPNPEIAGLSIHERLKRISFAIKMVEDSPAWQDIMGHMTAVAAKAARDEQEAWETTTESTLEILREAKRLSAPVFQKLRAIHSLGDDESS